MNETIPPRYSQNNRRDDPKNWWDDPGKMENITLTHDNYEYKLVKFIKRGGFSCTYLAEQRLAGTPLPRKVVIKILYICDPNHATEKLRRAVVEAYVLGSIGQDARFVCQAANSRTPHYKPEEIDYEVARQLYLNQQRQPYYFHVLAYMNGGTLREKIEKVGHLSESEALKISIQIGKDLAHLHTAYQILHRDINPSNLLSDGKGRWYWTDFGLAKLPSENSLGTVTVPRVDATQESQPTGTGGYIPLESSRGADSAQRDIYALSVTILEMLTGLLTPRKENPHWYQDWRPVIEDRLKQVKAHELQMILAKGFAEKKEDRYQTVDEFVRAIERYQSKQIKAPTVGISSVPSVNLAQIIRQGHHSWQEVIKTFKRGWQKLKTRKHTVATPSGTIHNFLTQISESPVNHLLPSLFVLLILRLWLGTWPEFYGATTNQLLPLLVAAGSLMRPAWSVLLALMSLTPLFFALSPLLGLAGLFVSGLWGYGLNNWSPTKQQEYTLIGCSIALAPVLADWRIALAIPVTIGIVYGRTRQTAVAAMTTGLLTGALTFSTLSLWAALVGATTLEPVFLFDPYRQAPYRFWVTDFSFAALLSGEFQTIWAGIWRDNPMAIINQLQVVWFASVIPLWGLVSWSTTGAITAVISKKNRHAPPRSIWNGLPASGWAVTIFISLSWLVAQMPGMPDWNMFPFVGIGLLTLLAANVVTALDYLWRN